jgi:hypothetical protein
MSSSGVGSSSTASSSGSSSSVQQQQRLLPAKDDEVTPTGPAPSGLETATIGWPGGGMHVVCVENYAGDEEGALHIAQGDVIEGGEFC